MRLLLMILCHVLLLTTTTPCFAASESSLRFAPLPLLSEKRLRHDFEPFAGYLQQTTNHSVTLILKKNYQNLLDGLLTDEIDIAFLGPLPYVILTEQQPDFVPIVRFVDRHGQGTYTCCLATFSGDHIDLDKERPLLVSLTQPYSTCGYLMTEKLLNTHHYRLNDGSYIYSGTHAESALDVLRGTSQVAGLKTDIAEQYSHLGLNIIDQSEPLPGFLLIANPRTVSEETIQALREGLLSLDPLQSEQDAQTTHLWGEAIRYGAMDVHSEDYDTIRQLLKTIQIPGLSP